MSMFIHIPCPNCGKPAEIETVDVGVGLYYNTEAGYICSSCDWQEGNELDGFCQNIDMEDRAFCPLPMKMETAF